MAETDIQNWLNSSFFETALRSGGYGSDLKVTSSEVGPAAVAGDNYACDILRAKLQVTLDGSRSTLSLIVKVKRTKGEMAKLVSESGMFEQEAGALLTIMPAVYRLLDDKSPGEFQPCTARCLHYHSGSPTSALVLDDLKEQGFRMADKTVGLDMQHCLLVMKAIAQQHAASAVLHLKDPEIFKPFRERFYCERNRTTLELLFQSNAKSLAKEVEKWPSFYERFACKLHRVADKGVDYMIKLLEKDDDDFNVFVHGDLSKNNMMFRYSDDMEKVTDVRFVDYQLGHFADPAQDLQYFLYTSASINLLEKHSVLLEEYYNTLHSTLTVFGCADLCPSLQQFHKQLDKFGRFAALIACTVLPVFLADQNNIPDVEKFLGEGQSFPFSERYKDAIKTLLHLFEQMGWLDFETA